MVWSECRRFGDQPCRSAPAAGSCRALLGSACVSVPRSHPYEVDPGARPGQVLSGQARSMYGRAGSGRPRPCQIGQYRVEVGQARSARPCHIQVGSGRHSGARAPGRRSESRLGLGTGDTPGLPPGRPERGRAGRKVAARPRRRARTWPEREKPPCAPELRAPPPPGGRLTDLRRRPATRK